jgi:hypothetical protein
MVTTMFKHSSHPSSERLRQAIDGRLTPPESAAVERHIVDCDACRLLVEQTMAEEASAVAAPSRVRALRSRLCDGLAHLSVELEPAPPPPLRPRSRAAVAVVTLAAIALAVGAQRRSTEDFRAAVPLRSELQSALPDAAVTPGAVHRTTAAELCAGHPSFDRSVSSRVRLAVLRDYGMQAVSAQEYELDYLITPELGGASTRQNLWPERYASRVWNARVKDQLEELLPRMVCEGRLDLAIAQRDIAADWIAAYRKYFHTDQPLPLPIAALEDDDVVVLAEANGQIETIEPLVALAQLAWR